MIAEAFLIGALALRPVYVGEPETMNEWIQQYHELKNFIKRIHPNVDILITNSDEAPNDPSWERLPFIWKKNSIWIKRRPFYDRVSLPAGRQGA